MSSGPRSSIRRWCLAAIAIVAAVPLALCGPAVAGGGGGGHGNNGKADSAPHGQAKGHDDAKGDNGKHKGHAKSRPSKGNNGKHKGHTKTRGGHDNGEAKPNGKTTICHSTGSSKNPYVTITVSNSALKAHARHHDGRDIIPAPATGCPKREEASNNAGKKRDKDNDGDDGKGKDKVTICHATGSDTNPFVEITISESAVDAHRRHQNGEDIIPAPAGGCPAAAASAGKVGSAARLTALTLSRSGVLGETVSGGVSNATAPKDDIQVLGETASGIGPEAAADAVDAAPATTGSLPFTGIDLVLIALAALGCLLAGVALKRALGGRAA